MSDIERKMGGVSYTINTIRELAKQSRDEQFYLLIGGDMLFSFREWYKYESILKESKVCAVARGGDNFTDMVLPTNVVDVSSTEVRRKIAEGADISELVPQNVAEYIAENDLYRG